MLFCQSTRRLLAEILNTEGKKYYNGLWEAECHLLDCRWWERKSIRNTIFHEAKCTAWQEIFQVNYIFTISSTFHSTKSSLKTSPIPSMIEYDRISSEKNHRRRKADAAEEHISHSQSLSLFRGTAAAPCIHHLSCWFYIRARTPDIKIYIGLQEIERRARERWRVELIKKKMEL